MARRKKEKIMLNKIDNFFGLNSSEDADTKTDTEPHKKVM